MRTNTMTLSTRVAVLAAVAVGLGLSLPTTPAAVLKNRKLKLLREDAVSAVVVTNVDPTSLVGRRPKPAPASLQVGPFDGPDTLTLYVLTIYDRTRIGREPFDQVATFTLPDGAVFQTRIDPVDPLATAGSVMQRPDLGPESVELLDVTRLKRLARALPTGLLNKRQMREGSFTQIKLPVSGTWITGHGLYGAWKVEIVAMQDGVAVSRRTSSFTIENAR